MGRQTEHRLCEERLHNWLVSLWRIKVNWGYILLRSAVLQNPQEDIAKLSSQLHTKVTRSQKRCSGDICNQMEHKGTAGPPGDLMTKDKEKPKGHKGFFFLSCCWKDLLLDWPGGASGSRVGVSKEAWNLSSLERRFNSEITRCCYSMAIPVLVRLKILHLFWAIN